MAKRIEHAADSPTLSLAQARRSLGWTLGRLAAEAGSTISTVSELERGKNKNPGYALVMRCVRALQRGGLHGLTAESVFPVPDPPARRRA